MNRYAVNRACAKCGATNAKTELQDALHFYSEGKQSRPLMRRDCPRCGYGWYELPLDAPDIGEEYMKRQQHIESQDANAICLCGAELVYRGSGLFVCPNASQEKGAA